MADTINDGKVSLKADEDLVQYGAVELNGSDNAELTDANGDIVFGVNLTKDDEAKSGDQVTVKTQGVVPVLVDGSSTALSVGDQVMPKGSAQSGKLVSHAGNAGDAFVGKVVAIEDGTSDGEVAMVRLYGDRTETT